MNKTTQSSLSVLLYSKLLHLYPENFRLRFEQEMLHIFALQLDNARCKSGIIGVVRIWLTITRELLSTAFLPRLQSPSSTVLPVVLGLILSLMLFAGGLAFFESIASARPATGQLVNVGDHRLFLDCSGPPTKATIILENGAGGNASMWSKVQSRLLTFNRVCSYDRAGDGQSDKPLGPQTPTTIAQDLHKLLTEEQITSPYVLVGASIGGVYVRRFTALYPETIAGLVLADSSHEEQYAHYYAISPAIAHRFATQDGRSREEDSLRVGGQLPTGQHLNWHYDVPLIVLEHKRPRPEGAKPWPGQSQEEATALASDWHELQKDLASRSVYGQLRETTSGHFMEDEQPEAIVQAVRDVLAEADRMRSTRLHGSVNAHRRPQLQSAGTSRIR